MKPSAEQQLQFLQHLQRLFEDGDFVATYKYALLMSLAELAVESDADDGELELPMVYFWAKAWKRSDVGIWPEFGETRLSFLEYLLIGVASAAHPQTLLNREGHNRAD